MRKTLRHILFTLLFFFALTGKSQDLLITGRVTNVDGEGLPNSIVRVAQLQHASTVVDNGGYFKITVPANGTYTLNISCLNHELYSRDITVQTSDVRNLRIVLFQKSMGPIEIVKIRPGDFTDRLPPVNLTRIASITQNFEDIIKITGLGVNSNNELTANYNVRGGNYDENLIYVNGIEIYRPFLARSGQQEGLSFINAAFVDDIFFSAGGFDSYYGDKLSSVLDIRYREPSKFGGSAQASLMGGQAHVEGKFAGNRGNYITGARYRANSYLLNSLPTQGDYNPTFFDYQFLANYYLDYDNAGSYKKLFVLGHFSSNNYRFIPQTRKTSWGTVNEAYQLRVFFEGQEETSFKTFTAATGYEVKSNDKLKLTFVTSVFHSLESEHFDVLGEYWINELETDPSKKEFGDSAANIGVGSFLEHGRNDLDVWIANVYHDGKYNFKVTELADKRISKSADLFWGVKFQAEHFDDQLSEWRLIDSAGYSIPLGNSDDIQLKELIKQNNLVQSYRATSYLQFTKNSVQYKSYPIDLKRTFKTDSSKYVYTVIDTILESPSKLSLTIGERFGYRNINNEIWFTPRASITYTPRSYFINEDSLIVRRNVKLRASSGLYYQPSLYRTMRGIFGELNMDIVAQKSWHNVIGADFFFDLWGRPFKFASEAYYKHMWDIVPYEVDNVRIRYYGENNAVAYAYGVDAKVNGEFVPGVESFFRIGYLKTMEDIKNDDYYLYLNSAGDTIKPGYTLNNVPTDSIQMINGYIPRPTDQRITFSIFFQDKMPRFENLKVSTNLIMGSRLPYGPPTFERYKDILRTKAYLRLDLGFMYDIINNDNKEKYKDKKILKNFDQMTLSLDAFNLLGVNNIISYQWLQDISGNYYAIPNHLTGRRINVRFIVTF